MPDPLGKQVWSQPINRVMTAGYVVLALGALAATGLVGLVAVAEMRAGGNQERGGLACLAIGPAAAGVLLWAARRNSRQRLWVREGGVRWTRFLRGPIECTYADISAVRILDEKLEGVISLGADGIELTLRDGRVVAVTGLSDAVAVGGEITTRCRMRQAASASDLVASVSELVAALPDATAGSPAEVFRRCQAADALGALGPTAAAAVPALIRTLTVPVTVDCVQVLRVAAARALWRIERRADLVLPHLTPALEDDYWGVARTAVEALGEMGAAGQPAAPDLLALAKRRLASGPFHFEWWEAHGPERPVPFLAAIAGALRGCAVAHPEARAILSEIARDPDERVRAAAGDAKRAEPIAAADGGGRGGSRES